MSRNTGNKSAAPRRSGSPLLTGILVGMVIGVGMAAGLAWYIMKSPSPFVQNEPAIAKPPADIAKPKASAGTAVPNAPSAVSGVADGKPVAANEPYFLQAGSFSNADDAEKLKARLALLGIEASTQTATIPDKGVWHRVRMGPYKNSDEMNRARNLLKQNGMDATPMRAQ